MAGQIAARMQNIDDDDFIGPIQKHQEVLPCPDEPEVVGAIHQNGTAPAVRLAVQDRIAPVEQLRFIKLSLLETEILNRPSGDLDKAGFRTTRQP